MTDILLDYQTFSQEKKDCLAIITLNRPNVANALSLQMIETFKKMLRELSKKDSCRILLIKASGKHFSAGADLSWMKNSQNLNYNENYKEAQTLAEMFEMLYSFSKPSIAIAKGAVFGGALGILSCCDIVIADETTEY